MYSYMPITVRLERKCMMQIRWKFMLEVRHQKSFEGMF